MFGCLRRLISLLVTLLIIVIILWAVIVFLFLPQLKEKLKEGVREYLDLPEQSKISVQTGSSFELFTGTLSEIKIESPEGHLEELKVHDLFIYGKGLKFDIVKSALSRAPRIEDIERLRLDFTVRPEDIEKDWSADAARVGIKDFKLKMDGENVVAKGKYEILGKTIPISITGRFETVKKRKIKFVAKDISISGAAISLKLVKPVLMKFGPEINLKHFGVPLRIEKLETGKEGIKVQTVRVEEEED